MTYSASNVTWISQRIQAGELCKPGPEIDDFTRKLLLGLWLETLAEIGQERFDAAFKQVLLSSNFRPDIAEIRKAAGLNRGIVDPVEREAMRELRFLIAAMRIHGPELKALPGRVIFTDDGAKEGRETPAPQLSERTENALQSLGMGSRNAGLSFLACHPALNPDDATERPFRARNAAGIEKRWIESWGGVR